jgi:hypothetical protein
MASLLEVDDGMNSSSVCFFTDSSSASVILELDQGHDEQDVLLFSIVFVVFRCL